MNFKKKLFLLIFFSLSQNVFCLEIDNLEIKSPVIFVEGPNINRVQFFGKADPGASITITYRIGSSRNDETVAADADGNWEAQLITVGGRFFISNFKVTSSRTSIFELDVIGITGESISIDNGITLKSNLILSTDRNLIFSGTTVNAGTNCPCLNSNFAGFLEISLLNNSIFKECFSENLKWRIEQRLESSTYQLNICLTDLFFSDAAYRTAQKLFSISSEPPIPPFCVRLEDRLSLAIFMKYGILNSRGF